MVRKLDDQIKSEQNKVVGFGWAVLAFTLIAIVLVYIWLDDPLQIESMLGLAPEAE
ncbi:hypothetical protein [Microvirga pudoricolor]|uniref:hypothetical protein n=1 Tax=Microvirga pudoricolor TaxID=2778729 RepID=UPI00194E9355|nr:hypothetical protein [Microvirga pudoricolor]MBM6594267.1 hypothetical protein [Microvirga pudoricolor]